MTPEQIFYAAVPVVGGWAIWVSRNINTHNAIIERLDKLVDILLEERLSAKDQNRRQAQESNHRRSYR